MTSEQLDAKYSQLTGLRFKVSELIEAADDADKKKDTYDHLVWHVKNGLIRGVDGIKELVNEVLPALAEALEQPSTAEPSEESVVESYTAEEAAAYNATLPGAVKVGDVQTPAVEAQEAVAAVEGVHYTQEEIDAATEAYTTDDVVNLTEEAQTTWLEGHQAYGKTTDDWKVEPVEGVEAVAAQDAVLYTEETAAAYNAQLPGAVKAGDPKTNA